jgi:hypothetical protein
LEFTKIFDRYSSSIMKRNISRKGAKHALSGVEGAAKKIKLPDLAFLASLLAQDMLGA